MSPSTDSAQQAQVSALCLKEGNIMPKEPRLPSYEEVVGKVDSTCLPSYRESRQPRYHPYARPFARPVKPDEERFFVSASFFSGTFFISLLIRRNNVQNTIYDDERIELIVPPARGRRGFRPLIPPLVWEFLPLFYSSNRFF